MPDSSRRSLARPLWRALQIALAAVLGSAVLIVGLTRTEVGRDSIQHQIESSFNQRFEGSLSIGGLSGILLGDVVATNVELRSSTGRLVASADSVVAEPYWTYLLASELSVSSLTLIRPRLALRRDSSGNWNLSQALHRRSHTPPSDGPLDLSLADINIRDGRVTSTRAGPAPAAVQNNWLFDYTRARVRNLSVDASVPRTGADARIKIQDASWTLPNSDLHVSTLRGQLRRASGSWVLEQLALSLDTTRIRAEASLESSSDESTDQPAFDLRFDQSILDTDELRRLVPRLSLRGMVNVKGHVEGSLEQVRVDAFTIARNNSFATVRGTITRQSSPVRIDATLTDSRLNLADVRAVWPALPSLPDSTISPLSVQASLQGTASRRASPATLDLEGQLAVQTPQGAVRGSLDIQRKEAPVAPVQYRGSFEVDSLDLAPFTGEARLSSRLNGRVEIQGAAATDTVRRSRLDVSLSPSRLGGRRFASANGTVVLRGDRARGRIVLQQPNGGVLRAEGRMTLDARPNYSASLLASGFDLSPRKGVLPSTRLNARLTLQGAGTTWRSLAGTATLNVDSSRVYRADSVVVLPPHTATLRLSDRSSDRPRLSLNSSVASLQVRGTFLGPRLWRAGRAWGSTLARAVERELGKPVPTSLVTTGESLFPLVPSPLDSVAPAPLSTTLNPQPMLSEPVEVRGRLRIRRSDILQAWWAGFPETSSDFETTGQITIGPNRLRASGSLSASRLRYRGGEAEGVSLQYDATVHAGSPLAETGSADLSISAHQVETVGPSLSALSVSLSFARRDGTLRLRADSLGALGPVRLIGGLHITPTTNELRIRQVSMQVEGRTWTNPSPASARFYSDATVISPLSLERAHPQAPMLQRIRIAETVSPRSPKPLSLTVQHAYLPPIARALQTPKVIGGNLNGRVTLQGGQAEPTLDATFSVRRLSYDRRILGNVRLQARYAASSPDLRLNLSLDSLTTADRRAGPDLVPQGARTVEPSELTLSGRIRLPEWAHSASEQETSQVPSGETFDLDADIEHADLFFFEYIFEDRVSNVQGFVEGPLHIGGQVRDPVFEADLKIQDGAVDLPRFGLEYEVSGPVEVDRQGIHLQDITVQGDEGSATVKGDVFFNRYEYFSFDLSGTLDGITVIDVSRAETLPFYGHIRASGAVTLTGPLSDATLRSNAARTTPDSELSIPVSGGTVNDDAGFIVFADSTGKIPDFQQMTRRDNILADRPEGQPSFVQGINIDLNVIAPEGSTVNLVFDPVVGDIVTAVGTGRVQLQRKEGDFQVYGNFNAASGTYLFTAGEVFVRRFSISDGTISWDGDPINAQLDLEAAYNTRASPSGLPSAERFRGRVPVTVQLDITGRVATPQVDLSLSLDRDERSNLVGSETLDAILNQPARQTEYATSVLLTNTFLLTTESLTEQGSRQTAESGSPLTAAGNQLAFNSVSQLVSSQLNRYLGAAFPNVDLNFGVQGENPDDLDLIYGVALRLLNERLIIRGEGIYTGDDPGAQQVQGPQGEFTVEVHLSRTVSANLFYRRRGDELTQNRTLTSSRGVGLSYQTEFSTWSDFFTRLFGWLVPFGSSSDEEDTPVAEQPPPSDSTQTANRP